MFALLIIILLARPPPASHPVFGLPFSRERDEDDEGNGQYRPARPLSGQASVWSAIIVNAGSILIAPG